MKNPMVNLEAKAVSHTTIKGIVEGFVRNLATGKIFFVQKADDDRKTYPVFDDGTVSKHSINLPLVTKVHLLDPADLNIPAGPIKMIDPPECADI